MIALASSQMQWIDLVGMASDDPKHNDKVGLLLVAEAHLYNAGVVISMDSRGCPSPTTSQSSADAFAEELADCRLQLLAMARPPINPTDCSQEGTMFTRLVGVPMENSLDLVIVWATHGSLKCKTFWPMPNTCSSPAPDAGDRLLVRWPKKAHPGTLSEAEQERTPWLTRWARATFQQGCQGTLVPGCRILPNRMRPVIFHAFEKAKKDASKVLDELAQLGWSVADCAVGMLLYG